MSQIISAAKRTVSKKTSQYEDLDDNHESDNQDSNYGAPDSLPHAFHEMEMNSVSVIPDGKML